MRIEQELYKNLVKDIVEEKKKLKEMKEQLLTKKVAAKAMKKKAEQDPLDKPSKFFSSLKYRLTSGIASINSNALEAMAHPADFAADKLLVKADKVLARAQKLENNTHKKAGKMAIRCAEMVIRLEEAAEDVDLSQGTKGKLIDMSITLDEQVQRLRPEKKEKEECSAQQSPSQSSQPQPVSSSTESSQDASESSLSGTPSLQTCSA